MRRFITAFVATILVVMPPDYLCATSTLDCGSDNYGFLIAVSDSDDSVGSVLVTSDQQEILHEQGSSFRHAVVTWPEKEVWLVFVGDEPDQLRFELFVDREGGSVRVDNANESVKCNWKR